jgi:hypothetical protein
MDFKNSKRKGRREGDQGRKRREESKLSKFPIPIWC